MYVSRTPLHRSIIIPTRGLSYVGARQEMRLLGSFPQIYSHHPSPKLLRAMLLQLCKRYGKFECGDQGEPMRHY